MMWAVLAAAGWAVAAVLAWAVVRGGSLREHRERQEWDDLAARARGDRP